MSPVRVTFGSTCWKVSDVALGSSFGGGFLICKSGGVGWIVAPASTEVSRTWYCRNDAVTTAQANAACGDWFIPSISQLQNPGNTCKIYWDSYSNNPGSSNYWSNTEFNSVDASNVCFFLNTTHTRGKSYTWCVRAFRCVTY